MPRSYIQKVGHVKQRYGDTLEESGFRRTFPFNADGPRAAIDASLKCGCLWIDYYLPKTRLDSELEWFRVQRICMLDENTIAEINDLYRMPDDAGPAWREAVRLGMDMTLIEGNLELTPWERLLQNDRALALVRELQRNNPIIDGESD